MPLGVRRTKWAENRGLTVRGNWSHDNHGPGMWTDINNVDVVYEDNVVTGNQGYGILHEISYRATIRGNVVQDTRPRDDTGFFGGGEIVVSASPDVEVYGNQVRGVVGIGILQQRRVDFPSPLGPHEARNVHVHDNTVIATDPSAVVAGMATDVPGSTTPAAWPAATTALPATATSFPGCQGAHSTGSVGSGPPRSGGGTARTPLEPSWLWQAPSGGATAASRRRRQA